jgi:hypothetical protein
VLKLKALFLTINILGIIVLIIAAIYSNHHLGKFREQWLLEQPEAQGFMQKIRRHAGPSMFFSDLSPRCRYHKIRWIYAQLIILFIIMLFGVLVLIYNLLRLNFFES